MYGGVATVVGSLYGSVMKRIEGAVAFITGGASGMGLGMAQVFSRAGMRVAIADIRQDAIDAALRQFPADNPGVIGVQLDVADRVAYVRAADAAERAAFMREKIFPHGMSPIEIGERVLVGIRRNDLWILTHSEYREGAQQRFDAILASFPTDAAPPERVTAEAMVVRNPLFVAERARRLAQG